jgi:hypothetical protein
MALARNRSLRPSRPWACWTRRRTDPQAVTEPVVEAVALAAETTETVLDATQDIAEAAAEPLVETVVAANEDIAEAVVEPELSPPSPS